jgi:hypothetical protein
MATKPKNPDTAANKSLSDEQAVRERAYEISESDNAGTPEDNWLRAEQELRTASDETA